MQKKFYINTNLERFFSFTISLILILTLNIIITNTLFKKINKASKAQFIQNCDEIIEDYAFTVETRLRQLESRIDLFYAKIAYKNFSTEKIREMIQKEEQNINDPFNMIVYADKNGDSWNVLGHYHDVTEREYFKRIMSGETKFYVSNIIESKDDGITSLAFVRPVYNENNEIAGMIMATCPIVKISEYFEKTNKRFAIQDANRKLIHHYDAKWINWVYSPWKYKDKILQTTDRDFHVKETTSTDGTLVYLFFRHSKIAPWTITYSVPISEFQNLEKKQTAYQNFLIEVIVIVLSLIFLLELWVHRILERHQILSTHIDSVTHLCVRSYFEKEVNKIIKRNHYSKFLMIESDLRGFKFINQSLGETEANKVLLTFSKILYEHTKSYDGLLSRGYADHFYTFIKINSVHRAMHHFKEVLAKVTEDVKKLDPPLTPKFGITFYIPKRVDKEVTAQTLISQANFAKNTIKDNSLVDFATYDEKLLQQSSKDNYIESHMETALANNEFFVMYQPKIDLHTEKVVGAEALVRWHSKELGYMPPNSFVPLFERNNFIVKLDFYVYEQVFKFLGKCIQQGAMVVPISVNMSRNHDKPDRFVHDFITLIKKYKVPAELVEVELLERSSMDKNVLREVTILLQKEGFKVAMDDFGSGESSLNMLSSIPVNALKFDRSFLFANDALHGTLDENTENFIETLVDLGKNLKKETIFEGVETEEQRDFLRKINCDQVQGYFYSKPLREDEYMQFLKKHC